MNLASDAEVDSFGAADWSFAGGAVGVSDCAIAPEMITPLTAVVIKKVSSAFRPPSFDGNMQAHRRNPAHHRDVVA